MARTYKTGLLLLAMIIPMAFIGADHAAAQAETMWMNIGDYHNHYSSTGAEPSCCMRRDMQFWPGITKRRTDREGFGVRTSLWIGARDVTDENGTHFPFRVVSAGPRNFGLTEFFPKPMRLTARFEAPVVFVDGLQSFDKPVTLTHIDPGLDGDRVISRESNNLMGVTTNTRIVGFDQFYHEDYHVLEHTFTNTGNTDHDSEIELPNQTLEDVYFYFAAKYQGWQGETVFSFSGTNPMTDYVGDGQEAYSVPHRGHFTWHGKTPWDDGSNLGIPLWTDDNSRVVAGDTLGRLSTPWFISRFVLHADKSPTDRSNDPDQPSHTSTVRGGDPITNNNDAFDDPKMRDQYAFMAKGMAYNIYTEDHEYPHHADLVANTQPGQSFYDAMANQIDNPARTHIGGGGWAPTMAFGPYTLGPGESVNIVWIEGGTGLDLRAAFDIGRAYKLAGGDVNALIEFDGDYDGIVQEDERLTKDHWVLTARDSSFLMAEKAQGNFDGGYNIPRAPKPPSEFRVISGADRIRLEWDVYADADHVGFEIWRGRNRPEGAHEDKLLYDRIATLGGSDHSFEDTEVVRGISYYYYIQSVGPVNNDGTALTKTGVPLKSSRYYTQTYDPAFLKRAPGSTMDDLRIVPNPWNLAASPNVRWPDQQDKLGFLDIPGKCTIKIYTELGELVEEIEHTDGTGDEFWQLTTSSRQVVVSGIYFAVIQDHDTGEQVIRHFVIIR